MNLEEKKFLESYNKDKYEKPSVTVDIIIFTNNASENQVLLIKRKKHPFKDNWAIPGGFVNIDESLEDAAKRELKEETNVDADIIEQLYTFGKVDRDPRMRVISVAYAALIDKDKLGNVQAGDDASEAIWFTISSNLQFTNTKTNEIITMDDLAFDHKEIMVKALNWLTSKIQ